MRIKKIINSYINYKILFKKKKKKYWLHSSLQKRHVKKMFDKFFNFVRMLNHLTNFLKFIKIIATHIDTNIKFISIFSKEKLFLKIKTISCGVWIMYSMHFPQRIIRKSLMFSWSPETRWSPPLSTHIYFNKSTITIRIYNKLNYLSQLLVN